VQLLHSAKICPVVNFWYHMSCKWGEVNEGAWSKNSREIIKSETERGLDTRTSSTLPKPPMPSVATGVKSLMLTLERNESVVDFCSSLYRIISSPVIISWPATITGTDIVTVRVVRPSVSTVCDTQTALANSAHWLIAWSYIKQLTFYSSVDETNYFNEEVI